MALVSALRVRRSSALLLLLSVAGCVHVGPVLFRTPCGMQVRGFADRDGGLPSEWTQASLAEAEARTLAMLAKYSTDPRTRDACGKLKGWNIYPERTRDFVDIYGRKVAGITNCSKDLSIAGRGDPRRWALPHELVHAVQRCWTPAPIDPGETADHSNWTRDGLRRVVDYMETWPVVAE